jgi:hypothetical protein
MTQPSPDQTADKPDKPAAKGGKVDVLTVGTFIHHDALLGRDHTVLGVVAKVGEALTVRPLEARYVQVDPADFTPLSADDV